MEDQQVLVLNPTDLKALMLEGEERRFPSEAPEGVDVFSGGNSVAKGHVASLVVHHKSN